MRIGTGWDLHRLEENRSLYIGGVKIPHNKGALAHSDGDVLLHALIDALLGATANGDIGTLFPPNDAQWKDAASLDLLQIALTKIEDYRVENVDCTVIIDAPKLAPFIKKIRSTLATALGVALERISVKAKTSEGTLENVVIAQVVVLLARR